MKRFTDTDQKRIWNALQHRNATPEERDFLSSMLSLSAANEPITDADYSKAATLAAINLSVEDSIFDRG